MSEPDKKPEDYWMTDWPAGDLPDIDYGVVCDAPVVPKPDKKLPVFPTGHWAGLDWVKDDVADITWAKSAASDYYVVTAWVDGVIVNLNDRTKLDAALRHRRDYERFNAEYSGTWAINKKTEFDELRCSEMNTNIDFSKLTAAQIAATRKLALEYTYTSPCPIWVAPHLQQCEVQALYCAVAKILQGEKTGMPIDWEQVWDDAETLKAKNFDEVSWDARTGALTPRRVPVADSFAALLNNGRHGRLPDNKPKQPKPTFIKTADGGFAAAPVKLRQPVAKAAPVFAYVWDSIESWTTLDKVTGQPTTKLIEDLTDQELWDTLVWLIANVDDLHKLHCNLDTADANRYPAAFWLTSRISFNSLVLSAIAREFTFMPTEAAFLRAYMQNMPDKSTIVEAKPWQRPFSDNAKLQDLSSDLEKRIDQTRNQQHTGRPARAIRKV